MALWDELTRRRRRTRSVPAAARRGTGPVLILSAAWLVLVVLVGLVGPWIAPHDYQVLDLTARLQPPVFMGGDWAHVLGTDELGRDVLSRLLYSIRLSLMIAFAATFISALIGTTLGFVAAHFRGAVEHVVLGLIDLQLAMPFMIFALAVLAFFGNSVLLFTVLMGFVGWERTARLARGLALAAYNQGYADAVRQLGASPWRVYARHILPNVASSLIVAMTFNFPEIILMEAGLSFLGLGVQPPLTSLGNMVGYGREYLQNAPWILLTPSAVIVLTTFSISFVGDAIRDRLNPERHR